MKWKGALIFLGLALAVSLLTAGCGLSRSQAGEEELRVWTTWGDDPAQMQDLLKRFGEANGLAVNVKAGVDSGKLRKALSGSEPPDLVILSGGDLVASYYQQGLVEPLNAWIEATGIDVTDIYSAPLAQCMTQDGTYLCLPWGCDAYALFWNKDLFEDAGLDPERPPQTVEELVEYASRLTLRDETGGISQIGFIPDLARSYTGLYGHMFGGNWYAGEGTELTADSQPMIEALEWQRQFYDRYGRQDVKEFVSSFDHYRNSAHPFYAGKKTSCQQCHRYAPRDRGPDQGFYAGKVAMMVSAEWQVSGNAISHFQPGLNYGVAPFPPPADHPERANTSVVEGAVVVIPTGVTDKNAAARLLAWMMSPEIVAEGTYASGSLPTSRTAALDPRFKQVPNLQLFMELIAHPSAKHPVTTPVSQELNQALSKLEKDLLQRGEGEASGLLNEVQAEFAPELKRALAYPDRP